MPFLVDLWHRLGRTAGARRGRPPKRPRRWREGDGRAVLPGDSPLHRLDPRAKVVAVDRPSVALFSRESFAALAVYGLAALAGLLLSRVPPAWFWRGLRPVLWLVALTFVVQPLFVPASRRSRWAPYASRGEGWSWRRS